MFFEKRGRFFELSPTFFVFCGRKYLAWWKSIFARWEQSFWWMIMNFWCNRTFFGEILGVFWGGNCYFLCSQMVGKAGKELRSENHNKMRGKNGALARARTRTPCNFALFAFTTFTKSRVRGSKWGVYEGNRNDVRESVVLECWKGKKRADFRRKEDTLEIAVFEVDFGRYCEGCESKKVEIPVTYARVGLKPQSVIRPQ